MNSRANGSNLTGDIGGFPTHPTSPRRPVPLCNNPTESNDSVTEGPKRSQLNAPSIADCVVRQHNGHPSKYLGVAVTIGGSKCGDHPAPAQQATDLHVYSSNPIRGIF
jgi:hypothetical protein